MTWWSWREVNTRSHPELGRENSQRRWYSVSRRGRVGRRQVFSVQILSGRPSWPANPYASDNKALDPTPVARNIAGWSSPVARQAHNLKVVGSNPTPATKPIITQKRPAPKAWAFCCGGQHAACIGRAFPGMIAPDQVRRTGAVDR